MAGDKMKVLVTGGAGFIGSWTVDLLLEKGYQVRILDSLQPRVHPRGKPAWVPQEADFIQGDVANRANLAHALEGMDYVIHLAAYQDYMPDFSTFIHTNTESSALLFELIVSDPKRYPVRKIVFASSQSVCGEGRYVCPNCAGKNGAVLARSQVSCDEMVEIDLKYIRRRSLWLDLKIMAMTPWVMLTGKGAH
ncbi:MAG: NAD-dependent epimerase/dehydratase family protein [Acidobacteria bacterium]|nr:NAD-dependent epimerase/dehydratase family protein [Acidobacteriota bacterium]